MASGSASRELVEAGLAAIANSCGEGKRAFTRVYADGALRAANAVDHRQKTNGIKPPLLGLPISIKDLFDVEGEITLAGSQVLAGAHAAAADASIVTRLRAAGAIIVGRTNMTEFAFSGLGLNPHYGTPCNPYERSLGRIPGGSSSGAAISVCDGMAVAAIGTDTGGSVLIPAALCGLTGFKPTARRVPIDGALPLAPSLDSVGPIAPTVACCAWLDAVLSGSEAGFLAPIDLAGVRLGVLQGYLLDELEPHVASCFQAALSILSGAGAQVQDIELKSLHRIPECNKQGGIAAAESFAWHRGLLEKQGSRYDPRVLSRILRGREISPDSYRDLLKTRQAVVAEAAGVFGAYHAILSPVTPRVAPLISALESSDEAYFDANAAMLRNPSVINFLDGCSLSIPCHHPGNAPVGLMVSALCGHDRELLRIGNSIEDALAKAGCAIPGR